MCKKLIYLTFSILLLAIPEEVTEGEEWIRAAYWDGRYPWVWSGGGESMRDALSLAGYEILDADQLKTWMDARIADRALSVVVFCRDIAPDTVVETQSATCTLRNYLDGGGKCVWYADIPFYYQGHSDWSRTWWGTDGSSAVLGFNAATVWDSGNQAIITPTGTTWGLTQTWISARAASPTGLTVLATDSAGNALAWVKHYVTDDNYRGFVRLWDTSGTPQVADVISVAEYEYGPTTKASAPSPTNGATDVPTDVILTWTPGSSAISHHIYFGTNQADVAAGTLSTDMGTHPGTTYTPGTLAYGTTYYWRIDEWDGATTYPGNIWSFTTQGQGEGNILFEYFWGTDWTLDTLFALPTYPDSPDQSEWRTSFEGPINWRDNYGTRVRGYLYPPATGNYTFWIASDDQSQLWLSSDEDPAHAVQIASVPGWTPPRDFDNTAGGIGGPEQRSSEITLEGGKRYYIEALQSEGGGGDNLAVAWQGPSIPTRAVISGTFLAPWIRDIDLKAKNPSPADGATLVAIDVTLTWEPGVGATSHHVYLGTNQADVAAGTGGTDRGTVGETSYAPGALSYGTTYYWRIDEVEADGVTVHTGDIWSFTTTGIVAPPISIPANTSVGTWDPVTRIYTLTKDVPQCIQINQDNLTLDGAGHRLVGPGSGNGIRLSGRTGVTLKDLNIQSFFYGISLYNSTANILIGNTCNSNNYSGIYLNYSNGNRLTTNTCNSNNSHGILLTDSSYNTLIANRASRNRYGIMLAYRCSYNTLTDNMALSNSLGISLISSSYNALTDNTASSNSAGCGIELSGGSYNTLTGNTCNLNNDEGIHSTYSDNISLTANTANSNTHIGIYLYSVSYSTLTENTVSNNERGAQFTNSSDNQIYNNNFIDNMTQARVDGSSSGNIFNLDKPIGGNFWSNWTGPDTDHDCFVDSPYIFTGGQDSLPWTRQDGWLIQPVDGLVSISCGLVGYDRRTGQFSTNVTVTNTSSTTIGSPVWLVIESISPPEVGLANPDGTTPDDEKYPYVDLSGLLGDDQLSPKEAVSRRIYFNNPNRLRFTFEPSVRGVILP